MVVLIEIPFFLSLFVSFCKECLILKRSDFVLKSFRFYFRDGFITNCCQLWLLLGLVLYKCRKNIKKDSIIPRLEIYLSVLILIKIFKAILLLLSSPLEYAEFSKRGSDRKFENNEDQKKNLSTQNQCVFLPKIR